MENRASQNRRKKWIAPMAISVLIVLSIVIVLASNKKIIDRASEPVDRTKIPVAVTVAKVKMQTLNIETQYPATTQPYEEAMLNAQTNGLVSYLNVSLGQHVRKGQVLGRLDTRILQNNLKSAEIAYQSAEINKQKLWDDYVRAKDLYENKAGLEVNMISAKNSYDNAANNLENSLVQIQLIKEQIQNANIIAPISGTISNNEIKQGEYVSPNTAIATISNVGIIKTTVFVDQQLSYLLKLHQIATIKSTLFPEKKFVGKIIYISPVADVNHNYQIDLLIENDGGAKLKSGTDVQVAFNTSTIKDALIIPKVALNTDEQQAYVYVVQREKAVKKVISTGIFMNDEVEVISGLQEGDTVITGGQINLTNGSNISITK